MPALRPALRRTSLAAAAVLVACSVQAQSLKDLYEAARAYDATYLSARAQAQSAEPRAAAAEALARPTLALTAAASTARVDPQDFPAGDSNAVNAALAARYPIINRVNDASIAQARSALDAANADLALAEQDLIVRVAQAYFDVLAAQDTLATVQANKTGITEQLASARRNFEVGTATITDTREAQAKFDKAVADEIAAENALRSTHIALDQLVGRTGVQPHALVRPVVLPLLAPTDVESWVTRADGAHPGLSRARVGLDIARLETEKARAAEKFTLDAVGSVGAVHASGRYPTGLGGRSSTASIGLQFSQPLYTGGLTENRIRETLLLEEKARQDLDGVRRAIAQNTRVAFLGVQSGHAQVKALEAAESSAKLALEATQLGYRVGVRVNLDVLNAQTQLFQTERDLARARYDVLLGSLRLRQASGQLQGGDLDAINALLAR
ncbi:MAG: channel protein TolC [Rubrivivax sp. SCN 71-131]|jgi:outer membrane protein|nr:MAG: channel protein TolC [Rubrivivax sp. SCN 71-131]